MVKKGSNKSSRMQRSKPKPVEEIELVQDVTDVPSALIDMKGLVQDLQSMRNEDADLIETTKIELEAFGKLDQLGTLIDACIEAIKAHGLTKLGTDQIDHEILLRAIRVYRRTAELPESEELRIKHMFAALVILTEKPEEPELVATVNPVSDREKMKMVPHLYENKPSDTEWCVICDQAVIKPIHMCPKCTWTHTKSEKCYGRGHR